MLLPNEKKPETKTFLTKSTISPRALQSQYEEIRELEDGGGNISVFSRTNASSWSHACLDTYNTTFDP